METLYYYPSMHEHKNALLSDQKHKAAIDKRDQHPRDYLRRNHPHDEVYHAMTQQD